MKKLAGLLFAMLLLVSCNDKPVEKPKNLIPEDKMVDIIYDLSLLEAIRISDPISIAQRKINPSTYIYKKYKVDSLQFAKSDRYYASDIDGYAKIYKRVETRLERNKKSVDSLSKIKSPVSQPELELQKDDSVPVIKKPRLKRQNASKFN
jgi:uncharacterized protein DUF4296